MKNDQNQNKNEETCPQVSQLQIPGFGQEQSGDSDAPFLKKEQRRRSKKSTSSSKNSEKSLFDEMVKYAFESKNAKHKDVQVWMDDDLKVILEEIRLVVVRVPLKHLLNGLIKSFLIANRKELEIRLNHKIKL